MEEVKIGQDGYVREATVSYKDVSSDEPGDWMFRTVNRPVRNMVKIFNIEDTTLMDDIRNIHDLAQKILEQNKISYEETNSGTELDKYTNKEEDDKMKSVDVAPPNLDIKKRRRRKKKSELENLEIQMKGWNSAANITSAPSRYDSMFRKCIAVANRAVVGCRVDAINVLTEQGEDGNEFNKLSNNCDESMDIFMI